MRVRAEACPHAHQHTHAHAPDAKRQHLTHHPPPPVCRGALLASCRAGDPLARRLSQHSGVAALLERPFLQLSTGQHRLLLIGEAVARRPRLLVLDEPFDGLDDDAAAAVQALLGEAASTAGLQVVLIRVWWNQTHNHNRNHD